MSDPIHPDHYKLILQGVEVQCIDVIEVLDLGFHLGSALKYAWRMGRKHDRVDEEIDKCLWYLDRWRERGYEGRDLRSTYGSARLRVELSGYLRTMCAAWRVRDHGIVANATEWMRELIEQLGIEQELVAYIKSR